MQCPHDNFLMWNFNFNGKYIKFSGNKIITVSFFISVLLFLVSGLVYLTFLCIYIGKFFYWLCCQECMNHFQNPSFILDDPVSVKKKIRIQMELLVELIIILLPLLLVSLIYRFTHSHCPWLKANHKYALRVSVVCGSGMVH